MEARAIVGQNIRAARERLDLTQEALADATGLNVSSVSRAERGAYDLRLSTILKLADALEVTAAELLRDV